MEKTLMTNSYGVVELRALRDFLNSLPKDDIANVEIFFNTNNSNSRKLKIEHMTYFENDELHITVKEF